MHATCVTLAQGEKGPQLSYVDSLTWFSQKSNSWRRRIRIPCLPNQCALRTWLAKKTDVPRSHGPDCEKSLSAAVRPTLPMPPHMAPPLGIGTGMPNYLKARVGELVSRTLPSMNLFPSPRILDRLSQT